MVEAKVTTSARSSSTKARVKVNRESLGHVRFDASRLLHQRVALSIAYGGFTGEAGDPEESLK